MQNKKKDKPTEEIPDREMTEDEESFDEAGPLESESMFSEEEDEDDDGVEELVPVNEALEDDDIPLDEKLGLVRAAWETSEAKAAEYLDGWQRAKAEFANYKKRVNRDREQINKDAVGRVVKNYLSVVDDLERALREKPEDGDSAAWSNGIELIYRKLVNTLESDGVLPMKVDGEIFDPNLHEAVVQIESKDHQSGQIIDVLQTGYMIGERVLRPARVCIAA
jgi:molecular chaperone GrpE